MEMSRDKNKKIKTVRFNDKVEICRMHVWDFAYRNSRKGGWMQDAMDRFRFSRRIEQLEKILSPVLNTKLRRILLNKNKK